MSDRLFAPLLPETRRLMDGIPALIDKTFPLPGRFRSALPSDVAELSRLLTSGRGERTLSYTGRPNMLSAYIRYFLPWNLYRLCRLLPGLDITLAANDRITDLGCGPLTFTAALWLSRPDLRSVPLEFYCIDRSGPVLEAGRKFFTALASSAGSLWKIHLIKGDLVTAKTQSAALVCAVNVFNEMYGDISRTACGSAAGDLQRNAKKSVRTLENFAAENASILTAEPGFPRCGELIRLMRKAFLENGRSIISPCPHDKDCPFAAKKTQGAGSKVRERWCHFAFETTDAPAALHKLSRSARLPKERAVLSFLYAGPRSLAPAKNETSVRVISDAFPLPHNCYGRYCCSEHGTILLTGEKNHIEKTASGSLVNVIIKKDKTDAKSGAIMATQQLMF